MDNALVLTAPSAMSAPLKDTPILRIKGDRYIVTSDSFAGSDAATLAGRFTDAALGGAAQGWAASVPAGFGVAAGRLVPGAQAADSFAAVPLPTGTVEVAARVHKASANLIWLVACRDALAGAANQVRVAIDATGAQIVHMLAGYPSAGLGPKFPLTAGAEVRLKLEGKTATLSIDGTRMFVGDLPAPCPGALCGIARSSTATDFSIDNFTVTTTVS